jgi:hypothetical protein
MCSFAEVGMDARPSSRINGAEGDLVPRMGRNRVGWIAGSRRVAAQGAERVPEGLREYVGRFRSLITTVFVTLLVAKTPARSAACRGLCAAPYAGWAMRAAKFAQTLLYESILARECLFVGSCDSGRLREHSG